MSGLGLIPDFYFNVPLTALSTPGGPGPLGLHMVDTTNLRGGCIGCGVPGAHAGPVAEAHLGRVMVDESPLGAVGTAATVFLVLGAAAGIGAGVFALRRRRRR